MTPPKKKTRHKHDWDLGQEACHACGAYSEYCRTCDAMRECDSKGKCVIIK